MKWVVIIAAIFFHTHAMSQTMRYVDINSTNPMSPYLSWATAAANIQDAVNVATNGDTVVVADGVYESGLHPGPGLLLPNRVMITNTITLRSVNGPASTSILGAGAVGDCAVRCIFVGLSGNDDTNTVVISGFTIADGRTLQWMTDEDDGGGIVHWPRSNDRGLVIVTNCIIEYNEAAHQGGGAHNVTVYNSIIRSNVAVEALNATGGGVRGDVYNSHIYGNLSRSGGGIEGSLVYNTIIRDNFAMWAGGGAVGSYIYNCTVVGNESGLDGGGIYQTVTRNSIVYHNTAPLGPNHIYSDIAYSCVWPEHGGEGNISDEPAFVDFQGGDFRLQPSSPCIDAGTNGYINIDIEGLTRPWDGNGNGTAVHDMGAHEFGSYAAGQFEFTAIESLAGGQLLVAFTSWTNYLYDLEGTTNLIDSVWVSELGATNIVGMNSVLTLILSNQVESTKAFRVRSE